MPGGEGDLFGLGKKLSPLGIHVLVFNFQGLWSSEGEFSFDSSMENIGSAIRFLKEEENLKKFSVELEPPTIDEKKDEKVAIVGAGPGGLTAANNFQ